MYIIVIDFAATLAAKYKPANREIETEQSSTHI